MGRVFEPLREPQVGYACWNRPMWTVTLERRYFPPFLEPSNSSWSCGEGRLMSGPVLAGWGPPDHSATQSGGGSLAKAEAKHL